MAESKTHIEIGNQPHRGLGLILHGYQDPKESIDDCRRMYEHRLKEATEALRELERGNVRVYYQRGVYQIQHRQQVWPLDESILDKQGEA